MITDNTSKEKSKTYVGIDFSLASPGICVITDKDGTTTTKWLSLYAADELEATKLGKKGAFQVLSETRDVHIKFRNKRTKQENYADSEVSKALWYEEGARDLVNHIGNISFIPDADIHHFIAQDTFVGMEGISFGSPGNTLIDISMATILVRLAILNRLVPGHPERFRVISPMTIKKFAIKGNAKKHEMYDALLARNDASDMPLVKEMRQYRENWVTPGGTVKKPVDDLVDATFIALLIKDQVARNVLT